MAVARSAGPAALALALVPVIAHAQVDGSSGRPLGALDRTAAQAPGGLEAGITSTLVLAVPAIGGQVSVPTRTGLRVEVSSQALSWMLEDGDTFGLMTQAQLRIPFHNGPPGSRRSLIAGVTALTVGSHRERANSFVRPHAGVSWQWQTRPTMDLRLDVHALIVGDGAPVIVPFATFSVLWHGARRPR
jgi:hypothetical protein